MPKKWCSLSVRNIVLAEGEAVENGVFHGIRVVGRTAASLFETGLFIEGSSTGIGLADLKKHRCATCFAGSSEDGIEKLLSESPPANCRRYDNVFQFPFGGKMKSYEKAEWGGGCSGGETGRGCPRLRVFRDQYKPRRAF